MKRMPMMVLMLYAALAAGCAAVDMNTQGDGRSDAIVLTLAQDSQAGGE